MAGYSRNSIGQFNYDINALQINSEAIWAAAGTVDIAAAKRFLITVGTSLITGGVLPGDIVKLTVGGETATVIEVISSSQLYTTALSAAGTYGAGEAGTITRAGALVLNFVVAATDPATIFLNDDDADFIDAGVCVADVVTLTVGAETASVEIVRDTYLRTTALSAAGTYAAAEAFTIANDVAKVIRIVCPRGVDKQTFIRKIRCLSDLVTAHVSILLNSSNTPIWKQKIGTSIFSLDPHLAPQADNTPILIEMTYTTITNLGMSATYECR